MEISSAVTFGANMNQLNQVSPTCEVEAARRELPLLPQKLSFTVRIVIREPYRKAGQKRKKNPANTVGEWVNQVFPTVVQTAEGMVGIMGWTENDERPRQTVHERQASWGRSLQCGQGQQMDGCCITYFPIAVIKHYDHDRLYGKKDLFGFKG